MAGDPDEVAAQRLRIRRAIEAAIAQAMDNQDGTTARELTAILDGMDTTYSAKWRHVQLRRAS